MPPCFSSWLTARPGRGCALCFAARLLRFVVTLDSSRGACFQKRDASFVCLSREINASTDTLVLWTVVAGRGRSQPASRGRGVLVKTPKFSCSGVCRSWLCYASVSWHSPVLRGSAPFTAPQREMEKASPVFEADRHRAQEPASICQPETGLPSAVLRQCVHKRNVME